MQFNVKEADNKFYLTDENQTHVGEIDLVSDNDDTFLGYVEIILYRDYLDQLYSMSPQSVPAGPMMASAARENGNAANILPKADMYEDEAEDESSVATPTAMTVPEENPETHDLDPESSEEAESAIGKEQSEADAEKPEEPTTVVNTAEEALSEESVPTQTTPTMPGEPEPNAQPPNEPVEEEPPITERPASPETEPKEPPENPANEESSETSAKAEPLPAENGGGEIAVNGDSIDGISNSESPAKGKEPDSEDSGGKPFDDNDDDEDIDGEYVNEESGEEADDTAVNEGETP
jgi:hypothetical protein